jgi:hypothetical protein
MGVQIIFETLAFLLPAVVLYFAVRYIMDTYRKVNDKKRETEVQLAYNEMIIPMKLQASERLVLLLERITPAQAVSRALLPGMGAQALQLVLLKNIREEFEHNVAQQLYVSPACWALIRAAKEEVIRLVNLSGSEISGENTGMELATILIEKWSMLDSNPVQSAIDQIKSETRN